MWAVPGLLTLAVTLVRIGHAQPWRDELATWSAATRPLPDLVRLTRTIDAATGPYYLLMHGWTALAGTSPTALRLPSALAMAAAAALTARLGARLVGDRAGLLAGLLFAVLPATSRYGQEARPYALATLLAVLATLLLVDALRRPTWRRWAGYAVAVAALGLLHLVALTLLAAHAVAVLLTAARGPTTAGLDPPGEPGAGPGNVARDARAAPAPGRRLLGRWLVTLLPTALLVGPLALVARGQRGRQLDWVDPARLPDLASLPGGLAQSGVLGGFLLGLAALGSARLGRRSLLPGAAVLLPVLLLFAAGTVVPLWVTRYLVFTVPFACVLAGAALAATTPAGTPRPAPAPPETEPPRSGPAGTGPPRTEPARTEPAGTGPPRAEPHTAGPAGTGPASTAPARTGAAATRTGAGGGLGAALAVITLAGLLGLPDQVALCRTHEWPRSAPVDYAGAARIVAAGQRPGDAVVYSPRDGWLFPDLGLAYHLGSRVPRDVLVVRDQRADGSLWAVECGDPARCLAGVDRVWLVVTGRRADPLAAVPGAKGEALRGGFTVRQVWPRPGLTVALLAR
ncbi:glycosyltransferase family 39 protein [Micromonospora sp. WMMD980]|uniref:glycosyltransferase family 39 protein n=1 Tax=Micromonospora sp. WMMD980 TaxID=3016088 RepID=UPI002417312E|nr:glycosyltransferase family 39 protein [Micromonospora sp. WMMD980]MDG4804900.1 glycosyltransferase family 39 protein [Micromonospora sp. WMMD980]